MAPSALKNPIGKGVLTGLAFALLLPLPESSALERDPFRQEPLVSNEVSPPSSLTRADVYASTGESENLFQFFAKRTKIGWGYDFAFNDNIQLQDNNRQEDTIHTLESVLVFADPRGAVLYGFQYEVNAFRYMSLDRNAIDHDLVSFFDLDPGGRTQFRLQYQLNTRNALTFGNPGVDILRRSSDFQRSVEHEGFARLRYSLSDRNTLAWRTDYSVFDDQVQADAATDRRRLKTTLDLEHDLWPTWTLFAGNSFKKVDVPGDKQKSLDAHGFRLGLRHEVSRTEKLDGTLEADRAKTHEKKRETDINFSGFWTHEIGARTTFKLGYTDTRRTSFATDRTQFRSSIPSFDLSYELTPLIKTGFNAKYEKQRSSGSDSASGTRQRNNLYSLGWNSAWQIREQVEITMSYTHRRSKSRDFTNRTALFGIEGTF